jgi:hypothetical protein
MSPYKSDDRTEVIEKREEAFVVFRSPNTAEHLPDYREIARFPTRKQAKAYLHSGN